MKRTSRRPRSAAYAAVLLPPAAAAILALTAARTLSVPSDYGSRLLPLESIPAVELEHVFAGYGYGWPPTRSVPPLELTHLSPGLETLAPKRKKQLFLRAILPLIIAANDRIRNERRFLLKTFAGTARPDRRRLEAIAERYRVKAPLSEPQARALLLRRCDTVPVGLVLAQAAKESGWGTSKFAVGADNLFGVWTWDPAAGVIPAAHERGARHRVRTYPDLLASVRDYLYNLNVGHAYAAFRRQRARDRAAGRIPDPVALARALGAYSQYRNIYTERLGILIRQNGLDRLPWFTLGSIRPPQRRSMRDTSQ